MRFSRYYNHEAGNRNIYSRRNLLNMSLEELLRRELELAYQYNTIGIPMDEELTNSQYVHPYTDARGFSYWQAGEERQRELLRQQESDMMYENAKQQLENNVQGFGINAPKQNKTATPQITPLYEPINQDNNILEGFGQFATKGIRKINKPNPFPDLVNEEGLEKADGIVKPSEPNYFIDPNSTIIIDERGWPTLRKKSPLDSKNDEPEDYPVDLPEESASEETTEELPDEDILEKTPEELSEEETETSEEEKTVEPYLTMEDLLGDESDEEREFREKAELEAFDRTWDKANGVEVENPNLTQGILTGGAAGVNEKHLRQSDIKKIDKNNLTWQENLLDSYLRNAELIKNNYPISSNMYTDARTDFSKAKTDKNATVLDNMNSLDSKTIEALKKYGVNTNEKGVYYNFDSYASKKFGESDELKKAIDKSLENIRKGDFNGEDLNFNATPIDAITNKNKFDRYSSIQHAKLIDAYVDEQGQKHGRFIDNYDFNKRPDTLKNIPNNHGYSLQEKGALENFFTVMDVIIEDEEEKEKLLNKFMKKFRR